MKYKGVEFMDVSPNEWKFGYKGRHFILREKRAGVYSQGKTVVLYELVNGTEFKLIKCIGWSRSDGYDSEKQTQCVLTGIKHITEIQIGAVDYLEKLGTEEPKTLVEARVKDLIEDYERRLKTVSQMIDQDKNNGSIHDERRLERLNTKQGVYRTIIAELQNILK